MSSRSDRQLLEDIREAIRRARFYVATLDYQQFLEDIRTQDAVIRSLEVMGEATTRLSSTVRAKYPDLPWKNMAGVRDKLSMITLASTWMLSGTL